MLMRGVASPRWHWRRCRNQDRELPEVLSGCGEMEFVAGAAMSADFAMQKNTRSGGLQPRSAATTGGDADMPSRSPGPSSETGASVCAQGHHARWLLELAVR